MAETYYGFDETTTPSDNSRLLLRDGSLNRNILWSTIKDIIREMPTLAAMQVTSPARASIRPSLLLDFANGKVVDPRVTFTRASTKLCTGPDGLLRVVGVDQPAFDHDPVTGVCKGLLIEEARTNLLTYSEQFDNVAWTKTRSTITSNAVVAPDGTLTADKVVEDTTATSSHKINPAAFTPTVGQAYTFVQYMKAGERTWSVLQFFLDGAAVQAYFDLANGVIGVTSAGVTAGMQNVGNGWYRCSVTTTATTTSAATATTYISPANNVASYTGDGVSGIYIWGAQLEAGSFPTSYIPTTTATVTRAADLASMTGNNFSSWYRQDEGTLVCKYITGLDTSNNRALRLYESASEYADIVVCSSSGTGQYFYVYDTTVQASLPASITTAANTTYRVSAAYKQDNFAGSRDGNLVKTDTSGTMITPSVIYLGGGQSAGRELNGHLLRLAYYPKRLTNAEIQGLSTP